MCLLLDHGLRVGEIAGLKVGDFDLKAGELRFYRPKVDKVQTHKLTADTLRAARTWFDRGDAPIMAEVPVLRRSRKGGALTDAGMTERAINQRVGVLGDMIGVAGGQPARLPALLGDVLGAQDIPVSAEAGRRLGQLRHSGSLRRSQQDRQ